MNDKGMRMKYFGMIALLLLLSGCAGNENAFLHILHDMKKSPHCTIVSHVPYDMQHIKHLSSEERSIFLERLEALFTQYPIQLSKEEIPPPKVIPKGLVSIDGKDGSVFIYADRNKRIYKIQYFHPPDDVLAWRPSHDEDYRLP